MHITVIYKTLILKQEHYFPNLLYKTVRSISTAKKRITPKLKRSWSLIEVEISSGRGCRDRLDTLLVFEGPIVHPLLRSIILFPWQRMRPAASPVTTPIRELVSTPVESRSGRCVPLHATFITINIIRAK